MIAPSNRFLRQVVVLGTLAIALVEMNSAFAFKGPYLYLAGGGAYLLRGKIASTTITSTQISPTVSRFSISYNQTRAFDYVARLDFGYLLYENSAQTYALGVETGFNYFGPIKTSVTNTLTQPALGLTLPVKTTEQTSSWAGDFEGVFRQKLGQSKADFIAKLGVGVQWKRSRFVNDVTNLPSEIPPSDTTINSGAAIAVGVGLDYAISKHTAFRFEIDGLMGKNKLGYTQGLVGFAWLI